jgi:uncharacterized protein YdhG (YjbR/CyaY superfamily)
MDSKQTMPKSIDEYIAPFPEEIQKKLQDIRQTIHETVPDAQEKISYSMPAFALNNRILVYFAAFKNHIGFFPTGSGVEHFLPELGEYKTSKGTIQFPLDQPLPLALVRRITVYRVQENLAKAAVKAKKK